MAKKKERAPFQASFRGPDGIIYTLGVKDTIHLEVIDEEGITVYKVVEVKPEKKEPEKTEKEGK